MSYFAHPWRCTIAGLLLATASVTARAANCDYNSEMPAPRTLIGTLGGAITVGRDVPVGTQIYETTYSTTPAVRLTCPAGSYREVRRYVTSPGTPSGYVHPTRGPVYKTSVPGIGYAARFTERGLPIEFVHTFGITTDFGMPTAIDITFYKVGDVAPGSIRASDLPELEHLMVGDSAVLVNTWRFVGSLDIVARTCTTPDLTIDLGEHLVTELKGAGTATNWVDVPVKLQDCPAFFGASRNDLTDNSGYRTTRQVSNELQYRVDATTIVDGVQSIMALSNATAPGTATGMGIQVVDANESPVGFGTTRKSGLTLTAVDGRSYTIPLKARYMQTAANVTAGTANGQATVTFVYL